MLPSLLARDTRLTGMPTQQSGLGAAFGQAQRISQDLSANWLLRVTLLAAVGSAILLVLCVLASDRAADLVAPYAPPAVDVPATASVARAYYDLHSNARMLLPARAPPATSFVASQNVTTSAAGSSSSAVAATNQTERGVCAVQGTVVSASSLGGINVVADNGLPPLWAQPEDLSDVEHFAQMQVRDFQRHDLFQQRKRTAAS